ncbi:hypothetical protein Y032_0434g1402 [Ancylostoma ceylanicum]|uniref:Uncharacterized protein n=1 Tax=Ancylostoma ceylanicum TaxID=53326 RepID=A0A016X011_9BILA|nr:hypothetical protein Y032_0434g1402 [Ancylostoma ceylanicum]
MARFFGWRYRQAGSGTRYYHPSYGHASRLGCNESPDNSSTPPQSQPTKDSEFSTTFSRIKTQTKPSTNTTVPL